jgi:hypothetical protein
VSDSAATPTKRSQAAQSTDQEKAGGRQGNGCWSAVSNIIKPNVTSLPTFVIVRKAEEDRRYIRELRAENCCLATRILKQQFEPKIRQKRQDRVLALRIVKNACQSESSATNSCEKGVLIVV